MAYDDFEYPFDDYGDYESSRDNSVNSEGQTRRQAYSKKKITVSSKLKRIIVGIAVVAIISCGAHALKVNIQPYLAGSYTNYSSEMGYDSLRNNTHRTEDYQGYWYDVYEVAATYEEGLDLDSFIYGVYNSMDTNRMKNMNSFISSLHSQGVVPETSFVQYCFNRDFVKEVDGQEIADVDAYKTWAKNHIRALNNLEEVINKLGRYEDGNVDIDTYIYQLYDAAGWNKDSKIDVMDLFLNGFGITFEDYLAGKGFVVEKNGEKILDFSAYEKAAKAYIATLDNMREEQKLVDEFRQGR